MQIYSIKFSNQIQGYLKNIIYHDKVCLLHPRESGIFQYIEIQGKLPYKQSERKNYYLSETL